MPCRHALVMHTRRQPFQFRKTHVRKTCWSFKGMYKDPLRLCASYSGIFAGALAREVKLDRKQHSPLSVYVRPGISTYLASQ